MASPLTEASTDDLPVYLDCAATTPVDPRVLETVYHYMAVDYGNAGSHTHVYGTRANRAVENAREAIAAIADARPDEVYFTSGATESNNLAILGLAKAAEEAKKRHIVTTTIEHKAVLEPMQYLERQGFEVTYIMPAESGEVSATDVLAAVRDDTYLVSVMHVNNETGVIQPLAEIAAGLKDHPAYLHTDASQGFAKEYTEITSRIDLISASAHKIYGPKGVGCLITRRRRFKRPPIKPLILGGNQERGLRSGTLPVSACAGFGRACEVLYTDHTAWLQQCTEVGQHLEKLFLSLDAQFNGDRHRKIPCILNISLRDIDSDALILSLRDQIAISNGSACTSTGTAPRHVLESMRLSPSRIQSATRWSWCHLTPLPPLTPLHNSISSLA